MDSTKATKIKKNARLEARVTKEQKQLIERAAFLRGQNLTEFMVAVLAESATQIIKDHELIELTSRDQKAFADALLNPPTPKAIALADAQWYKLLMMNQ